MRHLLRRILFYLVALWVSVTLNFLLPRLSPGNPVQALIGRLHRRVPPQTIRSLEILLGVNNHDSLWTQYLQYLNNLAHGDLGVSITYLPTPVSTIIAQDLPWTLMLVGITLIISFVVGTLWASSSPGIVGLGWIRSFRQSLRFFRRFPISGWR